MIFWNTSWEEKQVERRENPYDSIKKRKKEEDFVKKPTNSYGVDGKRAEEKTGTRRRYEPGDMGQNRYEPGNMRQDRYEQGNSRKGRYQDGERRNVRRERMTEEERMRRRRALRRKREQQRRRRLIAAAAVAVLVLGGGAVGIVHYVLRDVQTANVGLSANSGQAGSDGTITGSLQGNGAGNAAASDDGSGAAGDGTDSASDGNGTAARPDTNGTDISFSEIAQLDTLNSPYAILMDASTGEVLAEQNADTQMYPASMTKMLTAVTAMESVSSLDETVTMPYEIYAALYEEGASMAGFEAGEQASVRQLLYGVILPSGAECCITLADLIDGSESAFVQRMNEKAQELGMSSTHFVTCTGLHDAQHYSTIRDIAVLLQYALQSSDFREIFTAHSYSVAPTAQHPEGFTFYSTMFQSLGDASVTGGEILGGKTGYTEEAGLCLASLAQVNGREYILVTAGAPGSHDTEPLHTIDAKAVYNRIGEATKN